MQAIFIRFTEVKLWEPTSVGVMPFSMSSFITACGDGKPSVSVPLALLGGGLFASPSPASLRGVPNNILLLERITALCDAYTLSHNSHPTVIMVGW